jgi:O-antigen/teichoic acid export membrane protein
MLKRVLKMLGAQGTSVGMTLIAQYLLPPVFIHSYGIAKYGEWLALAAALSYLGSLNFGLTTYTSNQLTILRQRGDLQEYRRLQASTLAFLIALVVVGILVCAGIGLSPLPALLHLKSMTRRAAGLTAVFLGLLMLVHILFGYYNNLFMVIQETHRGAMWGNCRYFAPTLVAVPLALRHASFPEIAFGEFLSALAIGLASVVDLKRRLGDLPLGLSGANWTTAKSAVVPSGMFAMVFTQQFLLFQAPVLILQRLLGPEIVVLFSICRTILSTARRLLSMITTSISPEITFSFGSGDMKKLLDIFHYSERVVFSLIPVVNLSALLFSPVLLAIWLHKPQLFEPWTYAIMALISCAMSMREHKQYFQYSTNVHQRLAHIVFWGNLTMIAVSIPATMRFGLHGFMVTWLVSETTQMALLYRENKKLFGGDSSISLVPVLKLAAFVGISIVPCMFLIEYLRHERLLVLSGVAAAGTVVLFAVSYFLFGLNRVQARLLARFSAR